jgi:hypothetical protein
MNDSNSIFSNDSDTETFTDKFFNNIPEDSDEEECFSKAIDNSNNFNEDLNTLKLEVDMSFLTWKSAYNYIK